MEQWCVWLAVIIILAVLESITVNLTTIWFVISGLVALLLSFITDNYLIQFGVFVVLGVILLVTTKPLLQKSLKTKKEPTNAERIIGMTGIVTEKISRNQNGEVKVDGKKWTAYADKTINKDVPVKILKINGVKVKVEEEKE